MNALLQIVAAHPIISLLVAAVVGITILRLLLAKPAAPRYYGHSLAELRDTRPANRTSKAYRNRAAMEADQAITGPWHK